ncbi:MAG: hypothetical protein HYU66_11290 [Armatimonadetes bacterium]|nr:hypothetical protein [Armatimonadota bacterium]
MRRLCWLALLAGCAVAQPAADEMLANGGFEGDFQALAPAWIPNCYGTNQVRFTRQTVGAHGGAACQRVDCPAFEGGGVQFHSTGLPVGKGRPYTISVWVRGAFEGALYVGLRKFGEPYTPYLLRYFRIGPAWRRCVVVGDASDSDPDCGLFFHFASTGWLELDDASVRPGAWPAETAAVDTPPAKGNRVYNSGFELGTAGWAPLGPALSVAEGGAPRGRRCLNAPGGWAETRPFVITPGQIYTLSGWFRRPAGEAKLTLELTEFADAAGDSPGRRDVLGGELTVGPEWRRASATGLFEAAFTSGALLRLRCPGGFEADGLQVEEGALTDWAPQQAIEVAVDVPAPSRFPAPGGLVTASVAVASDSPLPGMLPLVWRIVDLWEKPVATGTLRLPTAGQPDARGTIALKLPAVGLYRLEVRAGGPRSVPGDVVLGVLPALHLAPRFADGFYGIHAPPALEPGADDLAVRVSARAGCTWHRIHDFDCWVQWFEVEPRPGQRLLPDVQTEHMRQHGYQLLGTLARTPPWAGKEVGASYGSWVASPPRSLDEFRAYVRDTVTHYRDRIHCWEIWNEPYGSGFFAGPPEEYAEVLKAGSEACRAADPRCTVVGICAYPGLPEWGRRAAGEAASERRGAAHLAVRGRCGLPHVPRLAAARRAAAHLAAGGRDGGQGGGGDARRGRGALVLLLRRLRARRAGRLLHPRQRALHPARLRQLAQGDADGPGGERSDAARWDVPGPGQHRGAARLAVPGRPGRGRGGVAGGRWRGAGAPAAGLGRSQPDGRAAAGRHGGADRRAGVPVRGGAAGGPAAGAYGRGASAGGSVVGFGVLRSPSRASAGSDGWSAADSAAASTCRLATFLAPSAVSLSSTTSPLTVPTSSRSSVAAMQLGPSTSAIRLSGSKRLLSTREKLHRSPGGRSR